jgi:hypothetical protein
MADLKVALEELKEEFDSGTLASLRNAAAIARKPRLGWLAWLERMRRDTDSGPQQRGVSLGGAARWSSSCSGVQIIARVIAAGDASRGLGSSTPVFHWPSSSAACRSCPRSSSTSETTPGGDAGHQAVGSLPL